MYSYDYEMVGFPLKRSERETVGFVGNVVTVNCIKMKVKRAQLSGQLLSAFCS